MSGLAGTQATAQQATRVRSAATEAGRIASENFKASTQQATEMGKASVDLGKPTLPPILRAPFPKRAPRSIKRATWTTGASARTMAAMPAHPMGRRGPAPLHRTTEDKRAPESTASGQSAPVPNELIAHELDQGVSPEAVGRTKDSLMNGDVFPLPAPPAAPSERPQPKITPTDTSVISLVQADVKTAGLQLGAVSILPMALHRNADDFSVFLKWVNSGTEIYLNIPRFLKRVEIFKEGTLPAVMQSSSISFIHQPTASSRFGAGYSSSAHSPRLAASAAIRHGRGASQDFLPKWRNWRRGPMRKTKYG